MTQLRQSGMALLSTALGTCTTISSLSRTNGFCFTVSSSGSPAGHDGAGDASQAVYESRESPVRDDYLQNDCLIVSTTATRHIRFLRRNSIERIDPMRRLTFS